MSKPIYKPTGRALEYSPYALNIYNGCSHGCTYCYAPNVMRRTKEDYFSTVSIKKNLFDDLRKQLFYEHETIDEQVLISFIGDAYSPSPDKNLSIRGCLKILHEFNIPTAILTKGGTRCLQDIDLFKMFGDMIQVGQSITWWAKGNEPVPHEPYAMPIGDRIDALKVLKAHGIRTFASFEPVFDIEASLDALRVCADCECVDDYKIGKLNHDPKANTMNWEYFLTKALEILRPMGKLVYIKNDLKACCPSIQLTEVEKCATFHHIKRTTKENTNDSVFKK
jgi:DNA repair photolyase